MEIRFVLPLEDVIVVRDGLKLLIQSARQDSYTRDDAERILKDIDDRIKVVSVVIERE